MSLTVDHPLHVGTSDGQTWRVFAGRISRVDMDSPGVDGVVARQFAARSESCLATLERPDGRFENTPLGSVGVIQRTEEEGPLTLELETDLRPVAVACVRADIVPAPNDHEVIDAGLTLSIRDVGAGHPDRIGILERVDGLYRFRLIRGEPLDPESQRRIDARLASFPAPSGRSTTSPAEAP